MKILVTGATGRVGQHLVEQLNQAGHQVRALTRNPAKAGFSSGVEVVAGDLAKPDSLRSALEGVTSLHMINFGGDDYAPLQTGQEIIELAQAAGVKRVTVLRGGEKGTVEQALEASSFAWTFLEPVEFMTGALDWAEEIRTTGIVRQPFGDRKTAIVHEADIAAVAAVALTEEGHGGQTYTITGPEVETPRQMIRKIGAALGRDIQFVELSEEQAKQAWQTAGTPQEIIDFMLWVYGNTPPVGYTVVPTVEQLTGKPSRPFSQWIAENIQFFQA